MKSKVENIFEKRTYCSIDLWKFIMTICVIAIHTQPLINCTNEYLFNAYESFARCSVPFFFLSAGFLLARKLTYPYNSKDDIKIIKNYLIKIAKMYLIWMLIYLPITIKMLIEKDYTLETSLLYYARGFFITGEHVNSWMLWYLLSTIYSLIIIMMLLKLRISPKVITGIGFIFFLGGAFIDSMRLPGANLPGDVAYSLEFIMPQTRMLEGLLYISLGMLLAKRKIPLPINIIMLLGGYVGNCLIGGVESRFFLLICAVGMFGTIERLKLEDSLIYPFMRKMSSIIYYIHLLVWTIYYTIIFKQETFGRECFFATTFFCVAISFIYVYIRYYKKYRKSVSEICFMKNF